MQVALVERDGAAWGAVIEVGEEWREFAIPLSDLRRVPLALLPRPYPQFLPGLFEAPTADRAPDPAELDGLQFSVGADLFPDAGTGGAHGFEVERVMLDTRRER